MVGWHHRLSGREFEQVPGVGDGQGSLACYSLWGRRVRHDWVTELNWIKNIKFVAKLCCWFHLRAVPWAGDFLAHSQGRQLKLKQGVNLLLHLGPFASTPRHLPGILGMFTDAWGLFSVFVKPVNQQITCDMQKKIVIQDIIVFPWEECEQSTVLFENREIFFSMEGAYRLVGSSVLGP